MAVALQGVGDVVVVTYAASRTLWGLFAGPPSKVHAPWGMQHPPPLARKRGATHEVLEELASIDVQFNLGQYQKGLYNSEEKAST